MHTPNRRQAATSVLALGVVAAAGLLAGCDNAPSVIKIGVAQPMSGNLAALGQDMHNGVKLAVEEINKSGFKIKGKPVTIEIVAVDDRANAATGKEAAQQLVDAGVVAVIGHLNSGVSIDTAPIYAAKNIAQLAISTNPKYTQLNLPTTFRLVANDTLQAKAIGSFAANQLNASKFAVLDDGTPYGKGLADDAAKELVAAKKQVLLRKTTDDKTTDFGAIVDEMAKGKVDVLVAALNDFQIEAIVELAAKAGYSRLRIIGGDTLKTNKLAAVADKVAAIYATSPIIEAGEFPSGGVFLENFRKLYKGTPVYGAHYAYDTVYVVADAIMRNKSADRAKLLERLKSPQFDGNAPVTRSMRFGPDGEQRYSPVAVYLLRKGVWQPQLRSDRW